MNRTPLLVGAVALATVLAGQTADASTITSTDTKALAAAETAYAKVLGEYKPGAAWLAQYRAALALVVTEQGRVTGDLYPPNPKPKPKPSPTTTTTTPSTTTTTGQTVAAQASASGDNADASIDPLGYYTGSESLLVQAQPAQPGVLTWDITCDEGNGGTADGGTQQATLNFPTTEQLTLPATNPSGGCSITADAQLNGSGTVTISWIVTGTEVNNF